MTATTRNHPCKAAGRHDLRRRTFGGGRVYFLSGWVETPAGIVSVGSGTSYADRHASDVTWLVFVHDGIRYKRTIWAVYSERFTITLARRFAADVLASLAEVSTAEPSEGVPDIAVTLHAPDAEPVGYTLVTLPANVYGDLYAAADAVCKRNVDSGAALGAPGDDDELQDAMTDLRDALAAARAAQPEVQP